MLSPRVNFYKILCPYSHGRGTLFYSSKLFSILCPRVNSAESLGVISTRTSRAKLCSSESVYLSPPVYFSPIKINRGSDPSCDIKSRETCKHTSERESVSSFRRTIIKLHPPSATSAVSRRLVHPFHREDLLRSFCCFYASSRRTGTRERYTRKKGRVRSTLTSLISSSDLVYFFSDDLAKERASLA